MTNKNNNKTMFYKVKETYDFEPLVGSEKLDSLGSPDLCYDPMRIPDGISSGIKKIIDENRLFLIDLEFMYHDFNRGCWGAIDDPEQIDLNNNCPEYSVGRYYSPWGYVVISKHNWYSLACLEFEDN